MDSKLREVFESIEQAYVLKQKQSEILNQALNKILMDLNQAVKNKEDNNVNEYRV